MQTIEFGQCVLVNDIEKNIILNLNTIEEQKQILLDFSNTQFIRIEALMYLISYISSRKRSNYNTKIKYFSNEKMRKYFYVTRFFETLQDISGLTIYDIVEDLPPNFEETYFSKDFFNKKKYDFSSDTPREMTDIERLSHWERIGFYPLTSLPFSTDSEKSYTLKEEPKKWTEGKTIISIIQKNLSNNAIIGDKISRHIIYESITNSIRHPKSEKFVITSCKQEKYYTLILWDNGDSIVDTLLKELEDGNPIKLPESNEDKHLHSCYCINKKKHPGRPVAEDFDYIFSYDVPDLEEKDAKYHYRKEKWFILLSSLFPGITRDPNGFDYEKSNILSPENRSSQTGGRGLTYLINTAVRYLGGEVRIRTSNFFLNIKKAENAKKTLPPLFFNKFKDECYVIDYRDLYAKENITPENKKIISCLYQAKINTLSHETMKFYGNMITIHIPQI